IIEIKQICCFCTSNNLTVYRTTGDGCKGFLLLKVNYHFICFCSKWRIPFHFCLWEHFKKSTVRSVYYRQHSSVKRSCKARTTTNSQCCPVWSTPRNHKVKS